MTEKQYRNSHPWISFSLDLHKASHAFWMLLGEAQCKCRHISGVPLRPEEASALHEVYLTKGVRATTAIEGNTLSESEVLRIVRDDMSLPPSKEYLKQEVLNVIEACNMIAEGVAAAPSDGKTISPEDIARYNHLILQNLPLKEEVVPGEIRTFSVVAGGYRGAPADECGHLLEMLCDWLNDPVSFDLGKRNEVASGILKAILAHLYLVWIHPFADGNGRTARLMEFRFLLEAGAPSPAAHLLSNHYNETREEYYRHLEISWRKEGGLLSFLEYALQGFVDQLQEQVVLIRNSQIEVAWENYVHTCFGESSAEKRRKRLLLTISREGRPVARNRILALDTDLAGLYEGKTGKTLSRDLSDLHGKGLLLIERETVAADKNRIVAFLPVLKKDVLPTLLLPKKNR